MSTQRPAPPSDTREHLLQAGWAVARERGLKGTTVRAVAAQAGANLGTFVYHFGTREAFIEELIERWYAPLFEQLQLTAEEAADPLESLRLTLLQLLRWIVEHRAFLAQLVLDAGAGEAGARSFLESLDRRHPVLLLRLITQAQQAGRLQAGDPVHQMLFLMSSCAAPVLLFHLIGRHGIGPPTLAAALTPLTIDPAQIETRLGWALTGLAAGHNRESKR
ncbi:TetR/AcrR family transcriptional regulator [Caldimonas brevitalea]|uniref:TetR family transcriptional regulator n=1 Tax=Caldimonas brevitalea TaxID=413882 RepID=A0A0G3BP17_9BURK|nr:TetR/AcrR family transcriptional regulator [Caldimonas brevitalea]AKJ29738.1 TetR family transcriptional regulator [Caldimonas brevitalea]